MSLHPGLPPMTASSSLTDTTALYWILSGGSWHPFVRLLKLSGVFVMLLLVIFLLSVIETKLILWPLAHEDAHTVGVLHHDISAGNIMLTDSGGMLIDWDMAKDIEEIHTQRHKTQTISLLYTWSDYFQIWLCWLDLQGTWQFMLAALITHIFTPTTHDFRDDLESSLRVLMWLFLMYSPCTNKDQAVLFFDSMLDPRVKGQMGGYNKADWLKGLCSPWRCPLRDDLPWTSLPNS